MTTQGSMLRYTALALALTSVAAGAFAQVAMPAKPTVYNNPQQPNDPRVGLKGGITDAAIAESGMHLVLNLPKPEGFAAGTTPQEKAPPPPPPTPPSAAAGAPPRPAGPPRALQLGSTNSDLAFKDHYVFVGNYNGFNVYDVANPERAVLKTSVMCPGSQDDITVYGNLLFLSVESTTARVDCGTQGIPLPPGYVPPTPVAPPTTAALAPGAPAAAPARPVQPPLPPNKERFRGVRIFDISDIEHPRHRPQRQGQHLPLSLRLLSHSLVGGATWLLERWTGRPQHRAVHHRRHPGAARAS